MKRLQWYVLLPGVITIGALLYGFYLIGDQQSPRDPERVDIVAEEPTYATEQQLEDASDIVVEGLVAASEPGRAITDPADPTTGLRTQLFTIEVSRVIKGEPGDQVVVEQESTLLDGTPITVNGAEPLALADRGTFYLVRGGSEQFPYTALTTTHGFVPAD
jgi:hypothetical protein